MTDLSSPPGRLQRIATRTHGIVTPANLLDLLAMAGTAWAMPRLDRPRGLAVALPSYLADMADGVIARRTHTASYVGELMDHVFGDKPKIFYGVFHIWRLGLADRSLLAAVVAYNASNALATGYDWIRHAPPQVQVDRTAKRAMFASVSAVGVQVIATHVRRRHPRLGGRLRVLGGALGAFGLGRYGVPTTVGYWRTAGTEPTR